MSSDYAQFDLNQEVQDSASHKPWQAGLHSKTLVKQDDLRVVLVSMEPGATVEEHHADGTITVQVVKGEIRFHAQDQDYPLRAGQLLTLGPSIKHSVEARGDSAFLLTISWKRAQK